MTDRLDGLGMEIEAANKDRLQAVFPECFTEGKLDIDKLLSLCGEYITDDFEKYEFRWKGVLAVGAASQYGDFAPPVRPRASILTSPKTSISRAIIWKC